MTACTAARIVGVRCAAGDTGGFVEGSGLGADDVSTALCSAEEEDSEGGLGGLAVAVVGTEASAAEEGIVSTSGKVGDCAPAVLPCSSVSSMFTRYQCLPGNHHKRKVK